MRLRSQRPCHLATRTLVASFLIFLFAGPLTAQEHADEPHAPYVAPATVHAWLAADKPVTFLDVRQPKEFHAGHLAGAINIVFDQVTSLAAELPHDQPIVTYCIHSTHRAPAAADTLQRLGFTNVSVLGGGIVAWQVEGFPIQASDLAQAPKILPQPECLCSGVATP